jgi:hypothetical protein
VGHVPKEMQNVLSVVFREVWCKRVHCKKFLLLPREYATSTTDRNDFLNPQTRNQVHCETTTPREVKLNVFFTGIQNILS